MGRDTQSRRIDTRTLPGIVTTITLFSRRVPEWAVRVLKWAGSGLKTYVPGQERLPREVLTNKKTMVFVPLLVHVAPILMTVSLVLLNGYGYFIGTELQGPSGDGYDSLKLSAIQIAAKVLELLIVASLSLVVFDLVRYKLLSDGLPFGLIGAGFMFSSASYLVSGEFLSSFHHIKARSPSTMLTIFVVLVAGLIAAFAGPSSAVLMLPRLNAWPAGGLYMEMNGTKEELWPARLDAASLTPAGCPRDLQGAACIASGLPSILDHLHIWREGAVSGTSSFSFGEGRNDRLVHVQNRRHDAELGATPNAQEEREDRETWAFTAVSIEAEIQSAVYEVWSGALYRILERGCTQLPCLNRFKWATSRAVTIETELLVVRVACNQHGIQTLEVPGPVSVGFPIVPEYNDQYVHSDPTSPLQKVNVTDVVMEKLGLTPELGDRGNEIAAANVELPAVAGQSATLGIVILNARGRVGNLSVPFNLTVAACSVDARWAQGSSIVREDKRHIRLMSPIVDSRRLTVDSELRGDDIRRAGFRAPDDGSWRRLRLMPSWFRRLAAEMDLNDDSPWASNLTVVDLVLNRGYDQEKASPTSDAASRSIWWLEQLLAMMLVDGISRSSYHRLGYQSPVLGGVTDKTNPHDWRLLGKQSPEKVVFFREPAEEETAGYGKKVVVSLTGYAIKATGDLDRFSMGVLLVYAVIGLGHVCIVLWRTMWKRRGVSGEWATMTELVDLVAKSQPGEGKGCPREAVGWLVVVPGRSAESEGSRSTIDRGGFVEIRFGESRTMRDGEEEAIQPDKKYV